MNIHFLVFFLALKLVEAYFADEVFAEGDRRKGASSASSFLSSSSQLRASVRVRRAKRHRNRYRRRRHHHIDDAESRDPDAVPLPPNKKSQRKVPRRSSSCQTNKHARNTFSSSQEEDRETSAAEGEEERAFPVALDAARQTDLMWLDDDQIEKPKVSKAMHRYIQLQNELKLLLISVKGSQRSGMSCTVGVGSLHEPRDRGGTAHFLEHMLFMGSRQYPDTRSWDIFCSENAGMNNAQTDATKTAYHFAMSTQNFEIGLKRYGAFMKSPKLYTSSVKSEASAVNAEFSMNYYDDYWRLDQFFHHLTNPESAVNHFSIGNSSSLLRGGVKSARKAARNFFNAYYSANLMKCAIYSGMPLDDLEGYARAALAEIPNVQAVVPKVRPDAPEQGLSPSDMRKIVHVRTPSRFPSLKFHFLFPTVEDWKHQPYDLVDEVLLYEGPDGLVSTLKEARLAIDVSTDVIWSYAGTDLREVSFELPDESANVAAVKKIGEIFFSYIRTIRKAGKSAWQTFFDDANEAAQTIFDYTEDDISEQEFLGLDALTDRWGDEPPDKIISAGSLYFGFDFRKIIGALAHYRPEDTRVTCVNFKRHKKLDQVEPWFKQKYRVEHLNRSFVAAWKKGLKGASLHAKYLRFPKPLSSVFFPANIVTPKPLSGSLHPTRLDMPKGSAARGLASLWLGAIKRADKLTASVKLRIYTPALSGSLANFAKGAIFASTANEGLAKRLVGIDRVGYTYSVYSDDASIVIEVSGWPDKIHSILRVVAKTIANSTSLTKLDFRVAKGAVAHALMSEKKNSCKERLLGDVLSKVLNRPYYDSEEQHRAVKTVTFDDIVSWMGQDDRALDIADIESERVVPPVQTSKLFEVAFINAVMTGNIDKKTAIKILQDVVLCLGIKAPPKEDDIEVNRVLKLETAPGKRPQRIKINTKHPNAGPIGGVALVWQFTDNTPRCRACVLMMAVYLREKFFAYIRTHQRMGYMASVVVRSEGNSDQMVLVAETQFGTHHLEREILRFVNHFMIQAKIHLLDFEFAQIKESVVRQLEREQTADREESTFVREVERGRANFKFEERVQKDVESMNRETFLDSCVIDYFVKSPWILIDMERPKSWTYKIAFFGKMGLRDTPVPRVKWSESTLEEWAVGLDKQAFVSISPFF